MSTRRHLVYPLLAAASLLVVSLVAAATPPEKMTVDDVNALLKAGVGEKVILRQVEATGTEMTLTVETILRLKKAGASDELLAALVGSRAGEAAPAATGGAAMESGKAPFRVYRDRNDRGEEVVHITNLDESGRRIGGEVADHATPNVVRQEAGDSARPEPEGRYDNPPPVVVNVYPPPTGLSGTQVDGGYVGEGPVYPGGLYPGYAAGYRPADPRRCARPGYAGSYLSPPGSYSHYLLYHHPDRWTGDVGLFSQPRAFSTLPYRVNTAAERNRMRFPHH